MVIGERLKVIREQKRMSQGDIEKRTGLLRCYVSRVENGHTVPSIETLEKWAKAMDISLAQLFATNGRNPAAAFSFQADGETALNRAKQNALQRIRRSLIRMNNRDTNILVGVAAKFAAKK